MVRWAHNLTSLLLSFILLTINDTFSFYSLFASRPEKTICIDCEVASVSDFVIMDTDFMDTACFLSSVQQRTHNPLL